MTLCSIGGSLTVQNLWQLQDTLTLDIAHVYNLQSPRSSLKLARLGGLAVEYKISAVSDCLLLVTLCAIHLWYSHLLIMLTQCLQSSQLTVSSYGHCSIMYVFSSVLIAVDFLLWWQFLDQASQGYQPEELNKKALEITQRVKQKLTGKL